MKQIVAYESADWVRGEPIRKANMTSKKPDILTTAKDVLEKLGTTADVVELTNAGTPQAVYNWGSRGYFPAGLYLVMTTALAQRGFEADPKLWRQHIPEPASTGDIAAAAAPVG
jgi:hypothetical protein